MLTMLLRLETGSNDCHSGLTGGAARNPIGELSDVIAHCYDARTGHVHIPGFYDDVRPLSAPELDNFLASGFDLSTFMAVHGLPTPRCNTLQRVVPAHSRRATTYGSLMSR